MVKRHGRMTDSNEMWCVVEHALGSTTVAERIEQMIPVPVISPTYTVKMNE